MSSHKLGPVVHPEGFGQTPFGLNLFEDSNQSRSRNRSIDLNHHRLPVEMINHIEGAKAGAPSYSESLIKSADHTWLGQVGTLRGCGSRFGDSGE